MTTTGDAAPGVGRKVGRGVVWSFLNTMILRVGTLASGVVLARLLAPADYGVYAVALVALTVLHAFNELGVSLALVRWQEDVRGFAPTVMTLSIGASAVLYGLAWTLAPAFCDAMGSPDAVGVLRVLALSVLLDGIAVTPAGLLDREFRQRERFGCEAAAFVVGTSVTIALAVAGAGATSFAVGRVAGDVVAVCGFLLVTPVRVRPGWNGALAMRLAVFGLPLAGASLLVMSVTSADQIVVGLRSDDATLGFYLLAVNVSSWPVTLFSQAARRVSLAGFSRLVDDRPALEAAVARGTGLLAAASIPACLVLCLYAEPLVVVVYGEVWRPAAQVLRVLALLGLVRVLMLVGYDLLVALDGSRDLLVLQAAWLLAVVPALFVGIGAAGVVGAATAQLLVAVFVAVPVFWLALRRSRIRAGAVLGHCVRPALGGVVLAGSALVVHSVLDAPLPTLLVGLLVAGAVYVPFVLPMRALLPGRSG